jgi:L-lactate dehydrogenase complex protein LldE
MIVDIFIPCFIDQFYPGVGLNMVKILEKFDIGVNYNTEQTCCGQIAYNNGYVNEARELGEKFIRDFSNNRYVVTPSASCVSMVRNYYPEMFHNTSLHNEYRQLQKNIFEFTDFLVNIAKVENTGATFNAKATYHDSCAALREYGMSNQPRTLLKNVKGLQLIEMKDSDVCCGFGGSFSVKQPEISAAMAEQKLANSIETGAEYIISMEALCLMNLDTYLKKNELPMKTIHIIDVLASGF